jgi:pyridoxamine 5'-phosphate oxidase family protein
MTFTESEHEYRSGQRLGRFATASPDGELQNNPVTFFHDEELGTIDIGGRNPGQTKKFRNVRANGQVAFVVDVASYAPLHGEGRRDLRWGRGSVRCRASFAGLQAGEIIRIHPRRILSWGADHQVEGMQRRTVA